MNRAFAAVAFLAVLVPASRAWDEEGHTLIGIIAYNQLSAPQKSKFVAILNAGEPSFKIDSASEAFTVGKTATWADFIKRNPSAFDMEIDKLNDWAFPPSARGTDNEGTRCRCWHYKNIVVLSDGRPNKVKLAPFDAVKAVNLAKQRFSSESSPRMKALWAYWLMHVVGDLHQPLHCVSSVEFDPRGDAGGNFFALAGEVKNLHWLWDNGISDGLKVEGQRGGLVEKASALEERFPLSSFSEAEKLDPEVWCQEGAKHAVETCYKGIRPNEQPSAEYDAKRKELSLRQATLAGYRLGAVLKGLLGG